MKKLFFLCALALVSLTSKLIAQDVPASERNALIDFYNKLDGNYWRKNTGWLTPNPVATWYGVTVENVNGTHHVTGINLSNNQLLGNVPETIIYLTELKSLNLSYNDILELSSNFAELNLSKLNLDNNKIKKDISFLKNAYPNIEQLTVGGNSLYGVITDIFTDKPNLKILIIEGNISGIADFSKNKQLVNVWLRSTNSIKTVNLNNGNNQNMIDGYMSPPVIISNPGLKCVTVDNLYRAQNNYQPYSRWSIDAATYSSDCSAFLNINDIIANNDLKIYPNPVINYFMLNVDRIDALAVYDMRANC